MRIGTIVKFVGIIVPIVLFVGLGIWFWYLRAQSTDINSASAGRGSEAGAPSFIGATGSTIANIAAQLGFGSPAQNTESQQAQKPPRLWKVNATPVAGMGFIGNDSTLRLIERSTGYVIDVDPKNGTITRKTNTLMPQTYRAYVTGSGGVILQSLADHYEISTFAGTLSTTTQDGYFQLVGTTLSPNMETLAVSPKTNEIAYILKQSQNSALITSQLTGERPTPILPVAVTDWDIDWIRDNSIILHQKPASGILGTSYQVKNSSLVPIVRNIPGLVTLPHSSSTATLYSSESRNGLEMYVRATPDASPAKIPIRTVAEKCVWLPSSSLEALCAVPKDTHAGPFLDSWYRGVLHTSDDWWQVKGGIGDTSSFFTMNELEPIDVTNPIIDSTGAYIAFVNGHDLSLWIFRIIE